MALSPIHRFFIGSPSDGFEPKEIVETGRIVKARRSRGIFCTGAKGEKEVRDAAKKSI
jgi:hypothetical protein